MTYDFSRRFTSLDDPLRVHASLFALNLKCCSLKYYKSVIIVQSKDINYVCKWWGAISSLQSNKRITPKADNSTLVHCNRVVVTFCRRNSVAQKSICWHKGFPMYVCIYICQYVLTHYQMKRKFELKLRQGQVLIECTNHHPPSSAYQSKKFPKYQLCLSKFVSNSAGTCLWQTVYITFLYNWAQTFWIFIILFFIQIFYGVNCNTFIPDCFCSKKRKEQVHTSEYTYIYMNVPFHAQSISIWSLFFKFWRYTLAFRIFQDKLLPFYHCYTNYESYWFVIMLAFVSSQPPLQ